MSEVTESGDRNRSLSETSEPDVHFAPLITLPEVQVATHEEDEVVVLKLRAKLYRFDCTDEPPEWKERGTGELKLLRHDGNKTVRLVMRRDKTLKVCANHFIVPTMELKAPSRGVASHKSFIYNVFADFSDGKIASQCLAIRFATPEIAAQFKAAFESARDYVRSECTLYNNQQKTSESDSETETDEENPEEEEGSTGSEEKENRSAPVGATNIPEKKKFDDLAEDITQKVHDLTVDQ